jgi:hypothetical protein
LFVHLWEKDMSIDNWPHLAAESVREESRLVLTDVIGHPLRVVQFRSLVAKDFIPGRVTIYLDAEELISDIKFENPLPGQPVNAAAATGASEAAAEPASATADAAPGAPA